MIGLPLKPVEGVTRWDPVRRLYALDLGETQDAAFGRGTARTRRRRLLAWLRRPYNPRT